MSTHEERSRVGRLGGLVNAAMHDPREYTKPARRAFIQRFYDQTDPSLPEAERHRRAEALLKAHMLRLSMASAKARKRRNEGGA